MYIDLATKAHHPKGTEPDFKDLYDDSYIRDITIEELADALSSICVNYPSVVHTPFPHILIQTKFGQIVLTDELQGYLKSRISMNHISIRCTLDGPSDNPAPKSPVIAFPIDPMFSVLQRKPYLSLKTKVVIRYESVANLLNKIADVVSASQSIYDKLYPVL